MIDIAPHVGATAAMTVRVITAVAIVSVIIALGAFVVIIDHLPELENAVLSVALIVIVAGILETAANLPVAVLPGKRDMDPVAVPPGMRDMDPGTLGDRRAP